MTCPRSPFIAALLLALVVSPSARGADVPDTPPDADAGWVRLPANAADAAWQAGEHRGWSTVGEVHLSDSNRSRLVGAGEPADPADAVLLSRGDSDLYTKQEFQDCVVKLEFLIPRGANSGVKLNGHYEIQIRDTAGKAVDQLTGDDCGGVYPRAELRPRYTYLDKGVAPKVNAAKPAGEWQSLEITFRAPRFDAAGKKTENARFLRVVLNGEVVHDDVELLYPTGAAWDEKQEIPRGPFQLQGDHGPVAFRRLAIHPLELE
jgi:hypothetical protein